LRIRLPGYARLDAAKARGIALESCVTTLQSILADETLYDFAARQPDAKRFMGRAPVYAVELPGGCGRAVVRRSMRGGALSSLHTDLFLPPTRSLRELVTSLRLRAAGIHTPEMIGIIVYSVGFVFRRSDIVTRELEGSEDLASTLRAGRADDRRAASLDAAASLVAALSRVGVYHPDLNLRNVLIPKDTEPAPESGAYVLDVDRLRFHTPGDPMVIRANLDRLERSMRKQRERGLVAIDDSEIATLRSRARLLAT